MQFNISQQNAIAHNKGPMLVLAGPGSGKTAVITQRIKTLIECHKVSPERILVITFSKAAAMDMKNRFEKLTFHSYLTVRFGTFHSLFFRILKNFYGYDNSSIITDEDKFRVLKDYIRKYKIDSENERELLLKLSSDISNYKSRIWKSNTISCNGTEKYKNTEVCVGTKKYKSTEVCVGTEKYKNIGVCAGVEKYGRIEAHSTWLGIESRMDCQNVFQPRSCSLDQFKSIYKDYVLFLNSEGKLDFDDMLTKCADLFEEASEVLAKVRNEYDYILIDEFQDINEIQYELIRKLAWPENNIFVVGDDDQSIYGFRGSSPSLMRKFVKDYKNAEQVVLNVNYRCRKKSLDHALRLVNHNKNRFRKVLTCAKGEGGRFEYLVFDSLEEVNLFVVKYLEKRKNEGRKLSDVAVLYRMNHQARTLYKELTLHNIPCRITEKMPCIFDHWMVGDLIAYMKLAQECDCSSGSERTNIGNGEYAKVDEVRSNLVKIINRPKRYVTRDDIRSASYIADGDDMLQHLIKITADRTYVADELVRLKRGLSFLKKLDVLSSIKFIRMAMGYNDYVREYADTKGVPEDELLDILYELEESANGCLKAEDWISKMEEYRKQQKKNEKGFAGQQKKNEKGFAGQQKKNENGFARLQTKDEKYFSGKQVQGNEDSENLRKMQDDEDAVRFLTYHTSKGLEFETVFILDLLEGYTPPKQTDSTEALEEERRALYVAMTRATENLFMLSSKDRMGRATVESRFIKEIFENSKPEEKISDQR